MELRGWFLLAGVTLGPLTPSIGAPATDPWRWFTAADGLAETACTSITPGPSGDVILRHPGTNTISIFDGFSITQIPGPAADRQRVFESPGGQLWTVARDGLREFRDGVWTLIPLAPVAEHFRKGDKQEIILLPVRQGRVLVLLPDELLQVSVESPTNVRQETLLRANSTVGGSFTNMIVARNSALLLAGRTGFARSSQPFRALTPEVRWEPIAEMPGEFVERNSPPVSTSGVTHIFDRVNLPGGVVWQATSNGLARFAPPIWLARSEPLPASETAQNFSAPDRTVIAAARELGSWTVIFKTRSGGLWFGGENKVAWARGEVVQVFTSTNQIGPEQVSAFAEMHDGRILCATPAKIWEFDGRNWLTLRSGFDHVNALLHARNSTLWVAANDGLHRFTRGAWLQNDAADGLPPGAVTNVTEDAAGRIIASTHVGDWEFDPGADEDAPRAFIPKPPDLRPQIREGEALQIAFTGRDRWNVTTSERLLFSHKLDEREWSPFEKSTEALFPELPVGRHLFLVRVMDRNANISQQPATLEFAVVLPWYRETRLLYVLASALVVALFFAGLAYNRHRHLQHSYANVERQVAERTRELELAQRELLHSQKMNALGTLSAGIAHDFNNILSIVKGSAQIIEDNTDNPGKIHTRVDRIKTVVQQGAGIVEAMLGFSRQSTEAVTKQDVNAVVNDTLKLLGDRFLRGLEIKFDQGTGLPEIPLARDFVQQVLLNFIFNAAEAMERRSPDRLDGNKTEPHRAGPEAGAPIRNQITIHTQLASAPPAGLFLKPAHAESYIQISVADTGEGITPENLPRIFEPFFTTKAMSSQRGTGLGLSMVYELARKLEAGLAVESQPGLGSTFTLILPVKHP